MGPTRKRTWCKQWAPVPRAAGVHARRVTARANGEEPTEEKVIINTVGDLIRHYQEAGYPDKMLNERPVGTREREAGYCEILRGFWGEIDPGTRSAFLTEQAYRVRSYRDLCSDVYDTGCCSNRRRDLDFASGVISGVCRLVMYEMEAILLDSYTGSAFQFNIIPQLNH